MKKRGFANYPVKILSDREVKALPETEKQMLVAAELWRRKEGNVLVLNVYDPKELLQGIRTPLYRIFQSKTDYITENMRKKQWQTGSLAYLLSGRLSWWQYKQWNDPVPVNMETEKIIRRFFGKPFKAEHPVDLIFKIQNQIVERRREEKNERTQRRIRRKMEGVAPISFQFQEWAERGPHWKKIIFYEYSRKKQMRGWCTHCGKEIMLKKGTAKHNKNGCCPSCKTPVTFIASGRKPEYMYYSSRLSKLEKINGKILYREFFLYKQYTTIYPATWKYGCFEVLRIFFEPGTKMDVFSSFTYEKGKVWHQSKKRTISSTILYPEVIQETLSGSQYRYSGLPEYAKKCKGRPIHVAGYLQVYQAFRGLEYFVKGGMCKIVGELAEYPYKKQLLMNGKDLKTVLDIQSEQELELARSNLVGLTWFKKAQEFLQKGVKLSNLELVHFFQLYDPDPRFLKDNQYFPLRKLAAYIDKQIGRYTEEPMYPLAVDFGKIPWKDMKEHKRMLDLWRDYVYIMEALGYDMAKEVIFHPYDLQKEHDRVYKEYEEMMSKKERAERRKGDRKLKKLLLQEQERLEGKIRNKKFQLVVPKNGSDIRKEGQKLGHCVGSYTDLILKGKCRIYFIRKREDLMTSYYTLEWRDGKIRQCRGKGNCGYNQEMGRFLKTVERRLASMNGAQTT